MSAPRSTILAVDDAEDVRRLVEAALGKLHVVKAAPDARTALRLALEAPRPDLVLLDADLGGASGYEVCKAMKATPALAELPVIFLSDAAKASDIAQGFRYGAIDCLRKPLAAAAVLSRVETHLEQLARERSMRLEQSREQLVGRLSRALELHIGWPSGNRAVRLAHYARVLAQAAGARDVACELIMKAAPLYDIGKLGVPAELLRKEALLQGAEREQLERHPAIGAEIIGESDDPLLKLARTVALANRERWDGSGYPGHLKGNDIAWGARVMAIVAAFEALTSPPYHRAPLALERAAAEIAAEAGKAFDPSLVEALHKALPGFRAVYETYADKHVADADDEVIGGPAPERQESEADRTLVAPLALRGTPVSNEALARMAGERAAAEDKAAQAARERRDLEQAAALAAEQRALAEEKLAQAAEKRIGAEARAGGADPQTAIALTRAQEMLAQLQKERGTLQAEVQRLQAALAEKEKERAPAQAPTLDLDDLLIGTSSPSKEPVADDDLVIGSPPAQKPRAATEAAVAERDKALAEVERLQAALTEAERRRALAATEREKALGERQRLQTALAEAQTARAAAEAEREQALGELQRVQAALAAAPAALEVVDKAALLEAEEKRDAAEALRDEVIAELTRLEGALGQAQEERQRSDTALARAMEELARANEEIARAGKAAAKSTAGADEAGRVALAEAQRERASAEAALAQAQREREDAERRIAEELAQVSAERQRNEELLAQLKASERAPAELPVGAEESNAAEARPEEAARRRRKEDEAAARAAEKRRRAEEALIATIAEREAAAAAAAERRRAAVREAAAQSLARPAARLERPAPRPSGVAKGFVLGVLAAAATGAALWFSGALESAPAPAPAAVVAPPAPAGR